MTSFYNSISSVLIILLLTAVGYFVGARGWMQACHKSFLSKFMLNIGLPCMCLSNLTDYLSRELLSQSLRTLLVPALGLPLLFVLSLLLAKALRLPRRQVGPFVVMSALSNAIFVGYAMCLELFGPACVPTVMLFYLINTVLAQSVALAIIEYSGRPESSTFTLRNLTHLLKRPPIWSVLLAMLMIYFELSLPAFLSKALSHLGSTVSPLGLLFTGFVIYEIGLGNLRLTRSLSLMLGVRFLLAPALCLLLCSLLGVTGLSRSVLTVEMAMPCITQVTVFSAEMGADEQFAAQGAALSTLLCFIVIPLVMLLL